MVGAMIEAELRGIEIVHSDELPWEESPAPGVWRKRLERVGPAEAGRVTSVVRYEPQSRFASHPHPDGEEILVLDGVFSDETGDYPAGSFLLNPEGFAHAPHSDGGCVLLVKLRQYPGEGRARVNLSVDETTWLPHQTEEGAQRLELYVDPRHPERIAMMALMPGIRCAPVVYEGGAELFVLDGDLEDEHGTYRTHTWARFPPGTGHRLQTREGCTFYLKTHHLRGAASAS